MKKFLSVISLLLVAAMLMSTPIYAVPDYHTDVVPGRDVITVGAAVNSGDITVDGEVTAAELTKYKKVDLGETPKAYVENLIQNGDVSVNTTADKSYAEKMTPDMDLFFAHDADYIYIAWQADAKDWDGTLDEDNIVGNSHSEYTFRQNIAINLGFDPTDPYKFIYFNAGVGPTHGLAAFGMTDGVTGKSVNVSDTIVSYALQMRTVYDDYTSATRTEYDTFAEGTLLAKGANSTSGRYREFAEIRIDKKLMCLYINTMWGTDYSELPNTMYMSLAARAYHWTESSGTANKNTQGSVGGDSLWVGNTLTAAEKKAIRADKTLYPDVIVFGESANDLSIGTDTTLNHMKLASYGQQTYYAGAALSEGQEIITNAFINSDDAYALNIFDKGTMVSNYFENESSSNRTDYIMENWDQYMADYTMYFAHDAENIYIGMIEDTPTWSENATGMNFDQNSSGYGDDNQLNERYIFRTNKNFRIGLNMDDYSQMLNIYEDGGIISAARPMRFTNGFNHDKTYYTELTATEKEALITSSSAEKYYAVPDADGNIDLTTASKKGGYGNIGSCSDSNQYKYIGYQEFTINKAALLDLFNKYGGTNYTEFPDAFTFMIGSRSYSWDSERTGNLTRINGDAIHYGTELTAAQQKELGGFANYLPTVIVLGPEGTEFDKPAEITSEVKDHDVLSANAILVGTTKKTVNSYDAKITEGEYAYKYVPATKYLTTCSSVNDIGTIYSTPTSNNTKSNPDMSNPEYIETLLNLENLAYYFAEDDNYYYVGIENFMGMNTDGVYSGRNNQRIRLGFNPDNYDEYIYLGVNGNGGEDPHDGWSDGIFTVRPTGTSWVTNEKIVTAFNVAIRTESDPTNAPGVYDLAFTGGSAANSAHSGGGGFVKPNKVQTIEIRLSKDAIRNEFNYDVLPNTMWFTHMTEGNYSIAKLSDANPYADGNADTKGRITAIRNGSLASDEEATLAGLTYKYVPDLVVFGNEKSVPGSCLNGANCAYTATVATPNYLVSGTTYYKSCATCGAAGVSTFEHTTHDYSKAVVDDKYNKALATCDEYAVFYKSCECGAFDNSESAATFDDVAAGYRPHNIDTVLNASNNMYHYYDCSYADCDAMFVYDVDNDEYDVVDSIEDTYRHVYNVTTDVNYPVGVRYCLTPGDYYKTCECGAVSNNDGSTTYNGTDGTDGYNATFKSGEAPGHLWADVYSVDRNYHWKVCLNETCDDIYNGKMVTPDAAAAAGGPGFYGEHVFDQKTENDIKKSDATCLVDTTYYFSCVCGKSSKDLTNETYVIENTKLNHNSDNVLHFDPKEEGSYVAGTSQHYNLCTNDDSVCDAENKKINFVDHVYDQEVIDEKYVKFAGDCKLAKVYYKSCVCGAYSDAENAATFETDVVLTNHVYGDKPVAQGNYHFNQCTKCLATDTPVPHTIVNGKCTVCGGAEVAVAPVPSNPGTVVPEETTPVETEPAETQPAETQPAETQPAETQPAETQPAETTPAETTPAETEPAVTEPAETEPVATEPAETEPADEAGCAGAISIMGLALVATLGACGVVATKKKDEE